MYGGFGSYKVFNVHDTLTKFKKKIAHLLTCLLTYSHSHLLTLSLTLSFTHSHTLTHSFSHTHSLTRSLSHLLTHLLTHSLPESVTAHNSFPFKIDEQDQPRAPRSTLVCIRSPSPHYILTQLHLI